MDLEITGLKNGVQALENSICAYHAYADKDIMLSDALRSGVIQNFEVAYELCWKYMQKWLELNISPDVVKGVPKKEFYRIAQEHALISSAIIWWEFHNARNATSHIYKEEIAGDVFEKALLFASYAKTFISALEKKI